MVIRAICGSPPQLINFLVGHPNPSLLPAALVSTAAQRILADPATSTPALLYGKDEGYWPLRVSLARWLNGFYGPARRSYMSQVFSSEKREKESDPEVEAARMTITGGASQSLGVVLSTFTDPHWTQIVWIAVPAYFLAFKIFTDAGFAGRMRAVPEDEEGVDATFLEKALEEYERNRPRDSSQQWRGFKPSSLYEKVYRHVIYVVPAFANPSSRTMSLKRREKLVRVARKFNALVVCDDVYDMLQWPRDSTISDMGEYVPLDKAHLPRLVDVDNYLSPAPAADSFGNVISNGSFTKILGPGMRTGWVESTPKFAYRLSQTGVQKSGGAPSQFAAVCISNLLEQGQLQSHVFHTLQPAHRRRWTILRRAIGRELEPLGVSVIEQPPKQGSEGLAGGYFIWITLPEPVRAAEVAEAAKVDENLIVAPGAMFEIPDERGRMQPDVTSRPHQISEIGLPAKGDTAFPRSLRLCYAWTDLELLDVGITKLGRVIVKCLQRQ